MGMFNGKTFTYKSHTIPMMRMFRAHVKMADYKGKRVPTGYMEPIGDWINTDEIQW